MKIQPFQIAYLELHAESGSVALEPNGRCSGVNDVVGDDKAGFRNFNYATQSRLYNIYQALAESANLLKLQRQSNSLVSIKFL